MAEFQYWPLVVAISAVLISIANYRLKRSAQSLRLELAERGERLLANPEISKDAKFYIEHLLDTAFGFRFMLLFGVLATPLLALCLVVSPSSFVSPLNNLASKNIREEIRDLSKIHDRITLANNPILLLLWELEILVFIPIALLISALIRGRLPGQPDRNEVASIIELKEARIFAQRRVSA